MENYSLSDIAAANGGGGFGGANSWVLIILFALIFGFGGTGLGGGTTATSNDIQRAVDLNSIQEGQAGISADIQRGIYEINGATKDVAYNNLSEIRDLESTINAGFANQQKCCCETQRAIDSVNYNISQSTAAINANTTASMQKVLDTITTNRMADMQARISQLETANMLSGVVKYPMATTYSSGANPYCAGSLTCGGV